MNQLTARFCNIIRERSAEHKAALTLLLHNKLNIPAISILRQELDSMVRAIIFLLGIKDLDLRNDLIQQTLANKKWRLPNSKRDVKDRDMVEFSNHLYGWAESVYKFGCAFIHLSPIIDYRNCDLSEYLTCEEIDNIKNHMNRYHKFPIEDDLTLNSLIPYFERVFDKISGNLKSYLDDLENERTGDNKF